MASSGRRRRRTRTPCVRSGRHPTDPRPIRPAGTPYAVGGVAAHARRHARSDRPRVGRVGPSGRRNRRPLRSTVDAGALGAATGSDGSAGIIASQRPRVVVCASADPGAASATRTATGSQGRSAAGPDRACDQPYRPCPDFQSIGGSSGIALHGSQAASADGKECTNSLRRRRRAAVYGSRGLVGLRQR